MNEHENCHVEPLEKPLDDAALSTAMAAYLAVRGMGCPRCAMRVRNGLLSLADVLFVEVLLEQGLALVAYNPERVTTHDLVRAVAAAGSDGRHDYRARVVGQAPAAQVLQG
ncbi:MAG: hypothetical protein BroJett011_09150 [Chloroflexota bacterium]|nr:MAG: hypothetical protein BroJett011_09150 [Chloroflexota bacterium]